MNPTILKFAYPATLIKEFDHWLVLLRPAQVTLGSLVLAAKGDATAYGDLPREAFTEQGEVVAAVERLLRDFVDYEKIYYVMPRYAGSREWNGIEFPDVGWPKAPHLGAAVELSNDQVIALTQTLISNFR